MLGAAMNQDDLASYEQRERAYVRQHGRRAVVDGFVDDATKIYVDLDLSSHLGFHRGGAPLSALLLLYEQTVVYVPPSSRQSIEYRMGMSWDHILMLIERGSIQPIIGHPLHYAGKGYFDDLMTFHPPSIWARGDELARRFAHGDEYWALARRIVPIDEMCAQPWIRAKWRRHFPRVSAENLAERIRTEIYTNFVDLCIYGYEPIACDLVALADRGWAARRILELSELLTYPTLMGLGGTANYGLSAASAIEAALQRGYIGSPDIRFLGPEVDILLNGLAIKVPTDLDPDLVVQFHQDGMASKLWRSLEELELLVAEEVAPPEDELVESAVTAQRAVETTMREIRSVGYGAMRSKAERIVRPWTDMTLKIGSAAALAAATHAPLGNDWMSAGIAGASGSSLLAVLKKFDDVTAAVERRVVDFIAERRTSKLATQMWWLAKWRQEVLNKSSRRP
jgi:hypothetical protein